MLFTELPMRADADDIRRRFGATHEEAARAARDMNASRCFVNVLFEVHVTRVRQPFGPVNGDMLWLSIKRRDRTPLHDWRELQEIKNSIVGPENEAFELYPSEARKVDTANQYHLFAFVDPKVRLPVGWTGRAVRGPSDSDSVTGAVQREFEVSDGIDWLKPHLDAISAAYGHGDIFEILSARLRARNGATS